MESDEIRSVTGRAIAVWLGLMVLAIANGGIREALMVPRFGPQASHVISTFLLAAAVMAAAYITLPWIAPISRRDSIRIGVLWLALTLAFEFLAGHFLFGRPWQTLFADYDLRAGRVWPLIPLVILIAPVFAFSRTTTGTVP